MSVPILYSFRRCPYAIRARLAICYSDIQVELREVLLKEKPQEMIRVSPKATVPVLIDESGRIIDESIEVMRWALEQNDSDNGYHNRSAQIEIQAQELIDCNDTEFKFFLDRYKYYERYPEYPQAHYFKQAQSFLKKIDTLLKQNQYLLGQRITWVDMAILPFIRQFAFVDKTRFDQLPYNSLHNWLKHFLGSALFLKVMVKYPQWLNNAQPCYFP